MRQSPVYLRWAALELLLALHMDFLVPVGWTKQYVIWVLAGSCWRCASPQAFKPRWLTGHNLGLAAAVLGALVFAHVLYHRPWSARDSGRSRC